MDLDSFLVSSYVLLDDWWEDAYGRASRRPGRPALLSDPELLALAIPAQWPRFRGERDLWRFADAHLRPYFPNLCAQGQFNRRVRALEPELRALQRDLAEGLTEPSAVYRAMDTTLIPAIVRVRASRKGPFCGQATFGRSASETEWVYGFKVALVVDPSGTVTTFGLAPASSDEGPIGDALVAGDRHGAYPAGKGFTGHGGGAGAALAGGVRGSGGRHPAQQLPEGLDQGRSPVGGRRAPDHRGGDPPAQGLLLPGAPPGEDVGRAAGTSGRQGRGLHPRPADQRFPRPAAASPGGPVGLVHCTSLVLLISARTSKPRIL